MSAIPRIWVCWRVHPEKRAALRMIPPALATLPLNRSLAVLPVLPAGFLARQALAVPPVLPAGCLARQAPAVLPVLLAGCLAHRNLAVLPVRPVGCLARRNLVVLSIAGGVAIPISAQRRPRTVTRVLPIGMKRALNAMRT